MYEKRIDKIEECIDKLMLNHKHALHAEITEIRRHQQPRRYKVVVYGKKYKQLYRFTFKDLKK